MLKREPNTRLTIDGILLHPWLNDNEEFCVDDINNAAKLPNVPKNVKHSVHNRVIDQMVMKGVGKSREHIERVLDQVFGNHDQPNDTKSMSPTPPPNGESTVNRDRHQSGVNHEHYIKATYQLLKDKSMREFHGLHQNNSSVNPNISGHLPKRLLPLRPRKHLIQQISKNTKPFQEEEAEEDTLSFTAPPLQLELPNDDGTGLVLPLQRKCSIVSEEGSCAAERTGSDLSSFEGPIGDRSLHEEFKPILPIVNIVVTDCSEAEHSDDSQQEEPTEELNSNDEEKSDSDLGPNNESNTTDTSMDTTLTNDTNGEHLVLAIKTAKVTTNQSTLHSVSSSPELLRNTDLDDMCGNNSFDNCMSQSSRVRPTAMILSNETKHDKQSDHLISHFGTNVSTKNSSVNSSSPSMRIIVQSKSCNNILFNENSDSNSDQKASELKSANSVCIKRHKTDRTDCCIIC